MNLLRNFFMRLGRMVRLIWKENWMDICCPIILIGGIYGIIRFATYLGYRNGNPGMVGIDAFCEGITVILIWVVSAVLIAIPVFLCIMLLLWLFGPCFCWFKDYWRRAEFDL